MVYPPRDEIKICDFGFCQEIDSSRHQYSMIGTPEFIAPEIVHLEPVTVATDIWWFDIFSLCHIDIFKKHLNISSLSKLPSKHNINKYISDFICQVCRSSILFMVCITVSKSSIYSLNSMSSMFLLPFDITHS